MRTLYLDVDGTLSPFSSGPPRQNTGWKGDWRTVKVGPYDMLYSVELVDRLNELAKLPDVEIVWATDWLSEAPELLAPAIGLHGENWAVLEASASRMADSYPWWKMEEIEKHFTDTEVEVALWADDNIRYASGIDAWRERLGPNFYTMHLDKHHGLTKKNMVSIENALTRLTPA
jgi:cyclopropane fatty-acyl-phospholipid synthase-like methyltransferase